MLEAGLALVTVGEIVGDRSDPLESQLLGRVIAQHVHRLRGSADGMQDEIILLLLREIVLGRTPMSDYDRLVKDWSAAAGDQVKQEYMMAMSNAG